MRSDGAIAVFLLLLVQHGVNKQTIHGGKPPFTDRHGSPAMYADHEQATLNTSFLPDWIANEFLGGVGVENNLDWRYIWYALDQVIRFGADADKLKFDMGKWSDGKPVMPIQVYLHSVNNSLLTSRARAFYSNKI
ncbi:hypothetical protein [Calothrix sp. NIES-2098]|uniref:hypothetical protein n=1 Tax=Calothrix sp. NIES-2098 TaxID=1954171 RepID=UPI000B6229AC|nr:hypothetical protein NIES2098_24850 [Calothrix sp. NIES-2098]